MGWSAVASEEFEGWLTNLSEKQQDAVVARIDLLVAAGPQLGRPVVDSINGSRHHNMKELRISSGGSLRVLFVFDPGRNVVLLVGGDKQGQWAKWYRKAIPEADRIYDEYLKGRN